MIPSHLPTRIFSTLCNSTVSNFPYLISILVFLELSFIYATFLIFNFSMHLELCKSHFASSVFPSMYLKMRENSWFGHLILVRTVELVFLAISVLSKFFLLLSVSSFMKNFLPHKNFLLKNVMVILT